MLEGVGDVKDHFGSLGQLCDVDLFGDKIDLMLGSSIYFFISKTFSGFLPFSMESAIASIKITTIINYKYECQVPPSKFNFWPGDHCPIRLFPCIPVT